MKYISMKMEPKGSRPPTAAMAHGRRYHALSGMGEGMRFTLRGCECECECMCVGMGVGVRGGPGRRGAGRWGGAWVRDVKNSSSGSSISGGGGSRSLQRPPLWEGSGRNRAGWRLSARAHLHGLSGVPPQLRPTTVPKRHSGKEMNIQMSSTMTMEPKGTAASDCGGWAGEWAGAKVR